jgi:serine protease Do
MAAYGESIRNPRSVPFMNSAQSIHRRPAPILLLTLALGLGLLGVEQRLSEARRPALAAVESELLTSNVFADLAEQTLPSVVAVYVKQDRKEQLAELHDRMEPFKEFFDDPRWKRFFESPEQDGEETPKGPWDELPEAESSGSGVIISRDGFIVTNNHIVEAAMGRDGVVREGAISVILNDDTEIPSEKVSLVAADSLLDIAVLKIDATGLDLKPITWGDSSKMRIGDWVIAIGNPLGLRGSVSKGIVSAKGRKIGKAGIEHLIQTDAMINPGNSGGALVNLKGELIGVNMAIATTSGFFQGIGFAVPSNDAKYITDQVIEKGKIERGYIGISMRDLEDEKMRAAMGLKDVKGGVLVFDTVPEAPAAKAGIERYDIIMEIDGGTIEKTSDVLDRIATKRVGEKAEIKVLRPDGAELKEVLLSMDVQARPPDRELAMQPMQGPSWKRESPNPEQAQGQDLGLDLEPVQSGGMTGLRVIHVVPGSPSAQGGIQKDDVLLEINRQPLGSMDEYEAALAAAPASQPMLVRFYSQRFTRELLVAVELKNE